QLPQNEQHSICGSPRNGTRSSKATKTRALRLRPRRNTRLFVTVEKRQNRLGESFSSLQVFGHPSISLRDRSVDVCSFELARAGHSGVRLRLFPIAPCSLRSALHLRTPHIPLLTFNSDMGHRDERVGAKAKLD